MKLYKILLILVYILFSSNLFSQTWVEKVDQNKIENINLYEAQERFNTYWVDKNVNNGYYLVDGVKTKAGGWKQFKRWENFWRTRINPSDGSFPTREQMKAAEYQYLQNINQNHSISGQWINLGPSSSNGGYAGVGRIATIAFHPTDADTYWIGAPTGGLWKTMDAGNTWNVLTDNNEVLGVSAIAIPSDYASTQTIYIGTGDRDSWHHNNGNGIFKSTDGGLTWQVSLAFNVANGYTVNQLLIHPTNNNIIYAATTSGIYKTTDAGASWNNIYGVGYISDLEFNPTNPSILYAASKWYGTIYKLTNDGANVSEVYNDADANRIELTVTADNPNLVYAIVSNSDYGLKGILKSTDQGDSFSFITDTPNVLASASDGSGTSGQGWYDLSLIADPNNQDILYAGGINTWKSMDGGASWDIVNHWWGDGVQAVHADKHFFAYNNITLYECNDGGLYSTDDGLNWTNISNGIINSQMYRLAVAQTVNNQTIAGLQDNGTKLLHSDGNWYDVVGGDGMNCEIDPTDENVMYGGIQNGKIIRTIDGWSSSDNITTDSDGNPINGLDETGAWVTPYLISVDNSNILYIALENVWKSMDRGDSWTKISNIDVSTKLEIITQAASNSQVIYVAEDNQIWRTTNDGASWTDITGSLPTGSFTSITIKNDDPNTAWVTIGAYSSNVIYQTTDGGASWQDISMGLPSIPANIVIQNAQNTTETELYLGTDFGVYIKRGSNNWELFNTGMPKVTVCDLNIYYDANPSNSKLRAASWGRGLWESDLYSVASSEPVADFSANQISICPDDTVSFTDLSTNTPTAWTWSVSPTAGVSYVNGTDANAQNPQIVFTQAGSYTISLTATNTDGSDDEIKTNYITVNAVPVVDFSADQTNILEGETVNFTDLSTNTPDFWSWSFSGGTPNSSASQNSSITYNTAGIYQVELTASNNGCSDTELKTAYIHVNAVGTPPVTDFSAIETNVCENTIIQFTDLSTNTPTAWTWSVSPMVGVSYVNGTDVNSQNPEISFAQAGSYTVSLTATNADGSDDESKIDYIIVNGIPNQPDIIVGADNVCENSSQVYMVTAVSGISYNWSLPSTWTGTSDTNSISTVAGASGGTISVIAENACGVSAEQTLSVSILSLPEAPIFDLAPTPLCEDVNATFSVINNVNYSYNWDLPFSWSGTSSTNVINVVSGGVGNVDITVNAQNACGSGPSTSVHVVVNINSPGPPYVTGSLEVCDGVESTYTASYFEDAEYFWQIPTGWTGTSSSNSITVTNNGISGEISVYYVYECGTSVNSSAMYDNYVEVINTVAEQPSIISGPNPVCVNSSATYSVVDVPGVTYYWNLPSGWSGTGHESSIDVMTNTQGGTITLVPFNACGMGIARTSNVSVNETVGAISSISGDIEVCESSVQTYSATALNASEYVWTLPSTWSGSSLFNSISTTVGNTGGYLRVYPQNACGQGADTLLWVDVNLLPISNFSFVENQSEVSFTNLSENADSYLWDFGDTQTSTEVNPIHNYANSGSYHVVLTATNQCSQDAYYSNINVTVLDLETINNSDIQVFPNPTSGLVFVKGLNDNAIEVMVIDATGKLIVRQQAKDNNTDLTIDLSNYSDGVYQVVINTSSQVLKQTIILKK